MKSILYFTALLTLVYACNVSNPATENSTQQQAVKPFSFIDQPIKKLGPALLSFVFSNSKGLVKKTKRGTVIMVPENAFVHEDGSPVKGEVTLDFKEIYNQSEIILSGIPMNVKNSKGVVTPFISDGMFSIIAGCGGKNLKLAEGKEITVSTVSNKTEKDFDYWYFDEKKGEWEKTGDRDSTLSEEEVITIAEKVNPVEVKNLSAGDAVSEALIDIETEMEVSKPAPRAPEAHNPKDFVFNIGADYKDYPELASYKNVLWKPERNLSDKERFMLRDEMSSPGANVALNCMDADNQIYEIKYGSKTIQARPVFIGSDKAKAVEAYKNKLKEYKNEKKRVEEETAKMLKAQKQYQKTYSLFAVNRMGIYNCDRFYSYQGEKETYRFKIAEEEINTHVYAILSNNQGVISLSPAYKQNDYYVLPSPEITGFIHTGKDGNIYTAGNKSAKKEGSSDVQLSFRQSSLDTPEELQTLIQRL